MREDVITFRLELFPRAFFVITLSIRTLSLVMMPLLPRSKREVRFCRGWPLMLGHVFYRHEMFERVKPRMHLAIALKTGRLLEVAFLFTGTCVRSRLLRHLCGRLAGFTAEEGGYHALATLLSAHVVSRRTDAH